MNYGSSSMRARFGVAFGCPGVAAAAVADDDADNTAADGPAPVAAAGSLRMLPPTVSIWATLAGSTRPLLLRCPGEPSFPQRPSARPLASPPARPPARALPGNGDEAASQSPSPWSL